MELQRAASDFLSKTDDEMHIDPDAWQDNIGHAAHVKLGKDTFNSLTYSMKYEKNAQGEITGAWIKPIDVDRVYKTNKEGQKFRSPDDSYDDKGIFVSRDKLNKLMTQGMDGMGGGGGMGAPPGMGMM